MTANVLWGLLVVGIGLIPVLASFDVIESDESDFGAPRWFVASTGFLFVLVGAWLAIRRLPDGPVGGLLRTLREPLLLALTPAPTAIPRLTLDAVPAPLRAIEVGSGSAADYDAWLGEVAI